MLACHPWNSGIRPRVYRPFEFVIPGTTDAADEMVRHLRHCQPLRQSERQWLDIGVTGWPAGQSDAPLRYRLAALLDTMPSSPSGFPLLPAGMAISAML